MFESIKSTDNNTYMIIKDRCLENGYLRFEYGTAWVYSIINTYKKRSNLAKNLAAYYIFLEKNYPNEYINNIHLIDRKYPDLNYQTLMSKTVLKYIHILKKRHNVS